jgi:hypothetical protein
MKKLVLLLVAVVLGILLAMVVFEEPKPPVVQEINEQEEWVPKARRGSASDVFLGNQPYGD